MRYEREISRRAASVLAVIVLVAGCGTTVYGPTPTVAPATSTSGQSATPATSGIPTSGPTTSTATGPAAQKFFSQFGAATPPFHVHIQTTLTGFPSGTAIEDADVDGRSYSAQLHVDLAGVGPHDSQVIYVDGTGYVADVGSDTWQAYPDYDTVPPVNPFVDLDKSLWQDMGFDTEHGGLDRIHSTTWRLPPESASASRLSDVVFDVWLDDNGLPVDALLTFQLAGTAVPSASASASGASSGYSAQYQFSNVGAPVTIVPPSVSPTEVGGVFTVTSSAFTTGGSIPSQYTCDGANQALPVAWSGLPAGTVELALILDDPDAHGFIHWLVVGIPAGAPGVGGTTPLPAGAREGRNDFNRSGYGGPCPPSGTHHYTVTLYALSAPLSLSPSPTAAEVRQAAASTTLDTAALTGTYTRGG